MRSYSPAVQTGSRPSLVQNRLSGNLVERLVRTMWDFRNVSHQESMNWIRTPIQWVNGAISPTDHESPMLLWTIHHCTCLQLIEEPQFTRWSFGVHRSGYCVSFSIQLGLRMVNTWSCNRYSLNAHCSLAYRLMFTFFDISDHQSTHVCASVGSVEKIFSVVKNSPWKTTGKTD